MSPLAVVLWLWLLVSVSIYGYRIYRRVTQGPKSQREQREGAPTIDSPTSDRAPGPATELIQNPVAGFEDASAGRDASPEPALPVEPDQPIEPTLPVEADMVPPPGPAFTPSLASSLAPAATPASERRSPRQPVGDALSGVHLPGDLSPLIGDTTRLDPFDLAFSTSTHDADHIRGGLAAELVRLGYQVAPTAAFRLAASRPGADLVVTIYPDPTKATEAGRPLYPSAAADSVVVRFQS